jgi:hypothetical protein
MTRPTRPDMERLARQQHEARVYNDPIPTPPSDWDLTGADLTAADLRGTELVDIDLRDAKIVGARIAEGTITHAAAGHNGGYCWHALRVEDGTIIIQFGCARATLSKWLTRGPEYGARYNHTRSHWNTGPAIAITAAERLAA